MPDLVVSDAGPLHYLILIDCAHVLPALFSHIIVPFCVQQELLHSSTPELVKKWVLSPPAWIEIVPVTNARMIHGLHKGESEALQLALQMKASRILIDDLDGPTAARRLGLNVVGTIGVLERAAEKGIVQLQTALDNLRQTSFFASEELFTRALERARTRKESL
jgi:predicted nucleic acid-binding protein